MATAFEHNDPATECRTASGVEVQRLATEVGAASSSSPSSPASSQVSDGVRPGHAVTAASLPGKVSRRSSPTATALTRVLYEGLAVRLAEMKFARCRRSHSRARHRHRHRRRWPQSASVRLRAGLMQGAAVAMLLRGKRPSTVRSTGADAMPRLRRGGMAGRARAAQARMRRDATREGGARRKGGSRSPPKGSDRLVVVR